MNIEPRPVDAAAVGGRSRTKVLPGDQLGQIDMYICICIYTYIYMYIFVYIYIY